MLRKMRVMEAFSIKDLQFLEGQEVSVHVIGKHVMFDVTREQAILAGQKPSLEEFASQVNLEEFVRDGRLVEIDDSR